MGCALFFSAVVLLRRLDLLELDRSRAFSGQSAGDGLQFVVDVAAVRNYPNLASPRLGWKMVRLVS